MIAIAEKKLVAGFRDSQKDPYILVNEAGAARVSRAGFTDVVSAEHAISANAAMKFKRPIPMPIPTREFDSPAGGAILEWLKKNPGPRGVKEIYAGTCVKWRYIPSALMDLTESGKVTRSLSFQKNYRWQAR